LYPRLEIALLGVSIQSHDLMVSLAVVVAATLGGYWAVRNEGFPAGRVGCALFLIAAITLVGGRLHFILANLDHLDSPFTSATRLSSGALHAPGAILGAIAGTVVVLFALGLPVRRFADGLAPAVGIGIATARMGCLLHGCCYGTVCTLPWAVTLSSSSYVFAVQLEQGVLPPASIRSLPVHPLPLYFAVVGVAITAFLLWLRPRKSYDGQLALVLVVLFSVTSAVLEPLRMDDAARVYWGPLPQLLWVTAVMAVLSTTALIAIGLRKKRTTSNE
jgi:phosphatidylglycerol:prolipoprotein diacylglycerol transferase